MLQSSPLITEEEDPVLFSWCKDNLKPTFIELVYHPKINFSVGQKHYQLNDGRFLNLVINRKFSGFITYTIICQSFKN